MLTDILGLFAAWLGPPTHFLLVLLALVSLFELGLLAAELLTGARALQAGRGGVAGAGALRALICLARNRIGRVDVIARVGPMLGLMGTLIPLGPGLAALGRGDVSALAAAVTVAFDTTVVGLAIGILGFGIGKARRRHYDRLVDRMERAGKSTERAEGSMERADERQRHPEPAGARHAGAGHG